MKQLRNGIHLAFVRRNLNRDRSRDTHKINQFP
jgi:hypothetical protein